MNMKKANNWLATGVIPGWFKEDMKRYSEMLNQKTIKHNRTKEVEL